MTTVTQDISVSRSDILALGLAAFAGLLLIAAAGFFQSAAAHDAAHDSRHAIAFPCH